jgi:pilus assembly protein Flp/PilA
MKRHAKDESGVTTVEYALIGVLVSIAAIAAMTTLGGSVITAFGAMSTAIAGAV